MSDEKHPDGKKAYPIDVGLVPDIKIWTVAPTKAQMRQIWEEMQAFIPAHLVKQKEPGRAGGRGGSGWKQDELVLFMELRDENGKYLERSWRKNVTWELKSADNPEGLQTVGLDFLHMTEAQDIKENAWNKVYPVLTTPHRFGRAIIEGIPPESPQHWFARNWKHAHGAPNQNREAFKAIYTDNPDLTEEDIEQIQEDKAMFTEEIWGRLYMAEQPQGRGGFFRKINEAAGRWGTEEITRPVPGRHYVAGLDIGRSNDPTVFVIKDRESRASVYAVELLKTDWLMQMEIVKSEVVRWNLEHIVMDSTGLGGQIGEDVLERELLEHDIPITGYNFTAQKQYQLFLDYAVSLESGSVAFPASWGKLQAQLEDIIHSDTAQRGHTFKTASGRHDDWVDAECLALFGCDPAGSANYESDPDLMQRGVVPIGNRKRSKRRSVAARFIRDGRTARRQAAMPEQDIVITG